MQANQVSQLNQERRDLMVPLDCQDLPVFQDDQEKMDPKEKTENQEVKEREVLKENPETQDSTDHQE